MSKFTFGKYSGISLDFVNSGYLKWIVEQDWFAEEFPEQFMDVEDELNTRDYKQPHFREDKVHI